MISAKLFMQQLWQQKLNWDQPIPSGLLATWHSVASNLTQTPDMVIPR